MNGVQPIGLNPSVQARGTKKTTPQQQKSNVGKITGVTTGAIGGATGVYFLNNQISMLLEKGDKFADAIAQIAERKFPGVSGLASFLKEEILGYVKDYSTKTKLIAGAILITIPALIGLGFGAIIDFMRNKNKATK